MSPTALKLELHELIDQVEDETVLEDLVQDLKLILAGSGKGFWDRITPDQLKQLDRAFEESKDPSTLIPHEEMVRRYF